MSIETCKNCNTQIGNLETAYLHDGKVVCTKCYKKLSRSPLKKYAIIFCVLILALIGGMIHYSRTTQAADELTDLQRMQGEAAQAQLAWARDLCHTVSGTFGTGFIDEVDEKLKLIIERNKALSPPLALRMLEAYKGSFSNVTLEQTLSAIERGAGLIGWEDPVQFMSLAGKLQKFCPEKSEDDIFDITTGLRAAVGIDKRDELVDQFKYVYQLEAAGIPKDMVIAYLLTAYKAESDGSVLGELAQILYTPRPRVTAELGRKLTAEQIMINKVADMNAVEYLEWLEVNQNISEISSNL